MSPKEIYEDARLAAERAQAACDAATETLKGAQRQMKRSPSMARRQGLRSAEREHDNACTVARAAESRLEFAYRQLQRTARAQARGTTADTQTSLAF